MKCIVLAAGKGTRMLPLTADRPKHMIPVNGRPFVDYIIESLRGAGLTEIAFIVNYKKEVLEAHLNENYPDVITIDQEKPLGTGHAVLCAQKFVEKEEFIVVMGDNLYSARDVRNVAESIRNVVAGLEVDDPTKYGVLVSDGPYVTSIVEKPKDPPSSLINTGLYRFTPEIFELLADLKPSQRGEYEITDALNILAHQKKLLLYELKDYWLDFGKPEDLVRVEAFLKRTQA